MGDKRLGLIITAKDDTSTAFKSVETKSKNLVKGINNTSTSIASQTGQIATKGLEKHLLNITKLLKNIEKNTKETNRGNGSGNGSSGEAGGSENKPEKSNNVGRKAFTGALLGSITGEIIKTVGWAVNQVNKVAQARRNLMGNQIETVKTLGVGGVGTKIAGGNARFFTGSAYYGLTGSQEAAMAANYGAQVLNNPINTDDEKRIAENKLKTRFLTSARVSTAFGIDGSQLSNLQGRMERFGDLNGPEAVRNQSMQFYAVRQATKVGMGGARMGEFFGNLENALESAIAGGFSTSNKEIINSLAVLQNAKDERTKVLAPQIFQAAQQTFGQGAQLKGGAGSALAMQAIWNQMPGSSLTQVRRQMGKGATAGNMQMMVNYIDKLSKDKDLRDLILMNTGMFGDIADIDLQRDAIETTKAGKSWNPPGGKTTEQEIQEGIEITKKRLEVTREPSAALGYEDVVKELKVQTQFSSDSLGVMNEIQRLTFDAVQGLDRLYQKAMTPFENKEK